MRICTTRTLLALTASALLLAAGCSDETPPTTPTADVDATTGFPDIQTGDEGSPDPDTPEQPDPGQPDEGPDAVPDEGPDAVPDEGPDAVPDEGPDAVPDEGPDAVPDEGPDAVPDEGPDAVPDEGPDAVPDEGPDAVPDEGPDAVPDEGPDAVPDEGPDAVPDEGPDAVPDEGPDAVPDAVPDIIDPDVAPDSGPDIIVVTPCTGFFNGECAAGEKCVPSGPDTWECVVFGTLLEDELCAAAGDCDTGLLCVGGVCQAPDCTGPSTQVECAPGDVCEAYNFGGVEIELGVCSTPCVFDDPLTCPESTWCLPDFFGNPDTGELEGECVDSEGGLALVGEACDPTTELPEDICVDGATCFNGFCQLFCDVLDGDPACAVGTCVPELAILPDGTVGNADSGVCLDACTPFVDPCEDGFWCVPNELDVTTGTCEPAGLAALNGVCDGGESGDPLLDCGEGLICIGGTCREICAVPALTGEPGACADPAVCDALFFNIGGVPTELEVGICAVGCDYDPGSCEEGEWCEPLELDPQGSGVIVGECVPSDGLVKEDGVCIDGSADPGELCEDNNICLGGTCIQYCDTVDNNPTCTSQKTCDNAIFQDAAGNITGTTDFGLCFDGVGCTPWNEPAAECQPDQWCSPNQFNTTNAGSCQIFGAGNAGDTCNNEGTDPILTCGPGLLCIGGNCLEICNGLVPTGGPGACPPGEACTKFGFNNPDGSFFNVNIGQCQPSCDYHALEACQDAANTCYMGEIFGQPNDICDVPNPNVPGFPLAEGAACPVDAVGQLCGPNAVCLPPVDAPDDPPICIFLCATSEAPFGISPHPDCPPGVGGQVCVDTGLGDDLGECQ